MWYGIQYNMVSPIQTVSEYEKKGDKRTQSNFETSWIEFPTNQV